MSVDGLRGMEYAPMLVIVGEGPLRELLPLRCASVNG